MTIKVSSFLIVISFVFGSCHGQPPDWKKSRNWRVYAISGQRVFSVSVDTLSNLQSKLLDKDSLQYFLAKVTPIPKERTPVWMGSYLSSYETAEGSLKKVEISTYGGFFFDEASGKYYMLPRALSDRWLDYISNSITQLKSGE